MPLAANSMLGPYEIKSTLGSGGMGEVFRARDSRLDRDVAVKVMHESSRDADRTVRFEREARTVAALNHPNIVAVFDFGNASGVQYAVSELVEGETLRALIQAGAVPTRKLVDIAAQMADGLAAAPTAGIVHRDLKPENVMLTRDGRVKILDFGLARQDDGLRSSARASANTAATIENITQAGQILGTANYMSPEQATGRAVDYRTDQFSFGLILYELASGRQAFAKDSKVETLAAIVREEPSDIEVKLPPPLRWTIDRCLAKEPGQRYESTRDLYHDLKTLRDHLSEAYSSTEMTPAAVAVSARRFGKPLMLTSAAAAILLAGLIGYLARPSGQELRNYKFTPFAFNTGAGWPVSPVWSADGKAVAYRGSGEGATQVFVRNLNASAPLQLTHMKFAVYPLGWAADGAHVILTTLTDGTLPSKLYSVSSLGGDPELLMEVASSANGAVSRDGGSFAAYSYDEQEKSNGVWLSTPIGSPLKMYSPAPFATKDLYDSPLLSFSPDGKKILLILMKHSDEAWLLPLPAGSAAPHRIFTRLPKHLFTPRFSWMPDSRHIVMDVAQNLWLADTESDALTPITTGTTGANAPAVSPDGKRILFSQWLRTMDVVSTSLTDGSIKPLVSTGAQESMAAWARDAARMVFVSNRNGSVEIWVRDGDGAERPVVTGHDFQGGAKWFFAPALSPDGNRTIYGMVSGDSDVNLWMSALSGGAPVRVTNVDDETGLAGSWSPDGSRFAFISLKNNELKLMMVRTTGAATPVLIRNVGNVADGDYSNVIPEWSPDGQRLTYQDKRGWHLISLDGKEDRLLGDFKSDSLVFSKDGQSLYGIAVDEAADKQSLFRYDLMTAKFATIKELDRSQRPTAPITPGIRFSLAPDGKSFVYSTGQSKSELWMLEGWQQPGWWERVREMF